MKVRFLHKLAYIDAPLPSRPAYIPRPLSPEMMIQTSLAKTVSELSSYLVAPAMTYDTFPLKPGATIETSILPTSPATTVKAECRILASPSSKLSRIQLSEHASIFALSPVSIIPTTKARLVYEEELIESGEVVLTPKKRKATPDTKAVAKKIHFELAREKSTSSDSTKHSPEMESIRRLSPRAMFFEKLNGFREEGKLLDIERLSSSEVVSLKQSPVLSQLQPTLPITPAKFVLSVNELITPNESVSVTAVAVAPSDATDTSQIDELADDVSIDACQLDELIEDDQIDYYPASVQSIEESRRALQQLIALRLKIEAQEYGLDEDIPSSDQSLSIDECLSASNEHVDAVVDSRMRSRESLKTEFSSRVCKPTRKPFRTFQK
jgi:hypothetical protein